MKTAEAIAQVEDAYLVAREARDRVVIARSTDEAADVDVLEAQAMAASRAVRVLLAAADTAGRLDDDDRRAIRAMRAGMEEADSGILEVGPSAPSTGCDDRDAWLAAMNEGGEALRHRLEGCFASVAAALPMGDGRVLSRLQILARLAREPDTAARRRLFLALEPLWRMVDGDGADASPYRVMVREEAPAWAAGRSRVATNARALGVTSAIIETWAMTVLAAWRAAIVEPARAAGEPPVEPWDWWWRAGAAQRALDDSLPLETVVRINRLVHTALGADLDELDVHFDLTPRPGRPPIPVAFTTFGARPHRRADGSWSPGRPTVLASLVDGGLGELAELVHETGHAIQIAGIRSRLAFADWPDSDALIEAFADLVSLDLAEPAWQRRWMPGGHAVPEILSIRCLYAEVALDAAWTLFEIRQRADPDRRPNDTWTDITATWLGIARHPDWSWWALRGQLVQEPGSMANYAIGAVLTAELRAAIRDARGDWIDGDTGWYPWVRERMFRFGSERSAQDVLSDVLGRRPTADALLAEISRGGRVR